MYSYSIIAGNTNQIIFKRNTPILDPSAIIKFGVRKDFRSKLLIGKQIYLNEPSNDWLNGIFAYNGLPGETALIPDGIYRYELIKVISGIVSRIESGFLRIEGSVTFIDDIEITGPEIVDIYTNLSRRTNPSGDTRIATDEIDWPEDPTVHHVLKNLKAKKIDSLLSPLGGRLLNSTTNDKVIQESSVIVTSEGDLSGIGDISISGDIFKSSSEYFTAKLRSVSGAVGKFLKRNSAEDHSFEEIQIEDIYGLILALSEKISILEKGIPNGVAGLDENGRVPISNLPVFNPAIQIMADIAARDSLTPTTNLPIYVKDATGDPTVTIGGAFYIYEIDTNSWIKLSEMESIDIVQDWLNIIGKPTVFPPTPHNHSITDVNGLQTILDDKRNNGAIPATDINEEGDRYFITYNERRLWNNEAASGGDWSGNINIATAFSQNRIINCKLIGNTMVTALGGGTSGAVLVIRFLQDANGGRTVSFPSNVKLITNETINLSPNTKSIFTMLFDGSEYLGSWKQGWLA